jgi:hypothetical protein
LDLKMKEIECLLPALLNLFAIVFTRVNANRFIIVHS